MSGDLIIVTRIQRPTKPDLLFGPNNRTLTRAEIEGLAGVYWPASEIKNVAAVAWCESGWQTGAWAYIGEDSRGLLQLNVEAHLEMGQYDLFDPQINFYFAYVLWSEQGWNPWTCAHELHIV